MKLFAWLPGNKPERPKVYCDECIYMRTNNLIEYCGKPVDEFVEGDEALFFCGHPVMTYASRDDKDTPVSRASNKVMWRKRMPCNKVNEDNHCLLFKMKEKENEKTKD